MNTTWTIRLAVLVAALGYFVDAYDLVLFSIVRVQSLKGLGIAPEKLLDEGVFLLNTQMAGMLLGGVLWGVMGDKRGRLSVLFGSIFLYSIANLANAFVHDTTAYAWMRFLAGIGLAGELGAGVTLVSEIMPKETRGYATTIIATVGVLGVVTAALLGDRLHWRTAYLVGGSLGLGLLVLRIGVAESAMFAHIKTTAVERGNFLRLFTQSHTRAKYIRVILLGIPVWYAVGILLTFCPELGAALGLSPAPETGPAFLIFYIGITLGDVFSGLWSQYIHSRKKALWLFLALNALAVMLYFVVSSKSHTVFYATCGVLGFSAGYWAVFITATSELFGTNLRATATTTVPNFVRGAIIPITAIFQLGNHYVGPGPSAAGLGVAVIALAVWAVSGLEETFGKDLNYLEHP